LIGPPGDGRGCRRKRIDQPPFVERCHMAVYLTKIKAAQG
jgi:hypothetical protein